MNSIPAKYKVKPFPKPVIKERSEFEKINTDMPFFKDTMGDNKAELPEISSFVQPWPPKLYPGQEEMDCSFDDFMKMMEYL